MPEPPQPVPGIDRITPPGGLFHSGGRLWADMIQPMYIVDAHLDLAYNAVRGREIRRPASEQIPDSEGIPTVGLPDLRAAADGAGIGFVCATIFTPGDDGTYGDKVFSGDSQVDAWKQMRLYLQLMKEGEIDLISSASEVPTTGCASGSVGGVRGGVPCVILMEGADPMKTPADVKMWFDLGVRVVGMAWKRTRYAGGTGAPGGLTEQGRQLVREMDRFGMIHDVSHLAEESFWDLLALSTGPIFASHSNCRAFVPTDRQLSDEMIKALIHRGGVVGINYFDKFLLRPDVYKTRRATLSDVADHMDHICQLAGNTRHVGIGTDMDGGLGRENIPHEVTTSADLGKLADALGSRGYSDTDITGIMGENLASFFRRSLPRNN